MLSYLPTELGRTTIVLGAGATRGARLRGGDGFPQPPLDADFITQVQRIKGEHHQTHISKLIEFCTQEFGTGWSLRMEQLYNHIHYAEYIFKGDDKFLKNLQHLSGKFHLTVRKSMPLKPKEAEVSFKQCLLAVLSESLYGNHSQNCLKNTCAYHDNIAINLEPRDSIVSFNYDCLIDSSLVAHCNLWSPTTGYGIPTINDSGRKYWTNPQFAHSKEVLPVKLLKLHGSINWQRRNDRIKLMQRPYTRTFGNRRFYIVPPVISKELDISSGPLQSAWELAFLSLSLSESIIVIGYSCPDLDPLARSLFYKASQAIACRPRNTGLSNFIVVDPNNEVRSRMRNIYRHAITPATRVHSFNSLQEMDNILFSKTS